MRTKLLAALSLATLAAGPVLAVPVTYEFSGITNGTSVPWNGNYFVDMGIPHATAFTGQFVLESDTAPYYADGMQRSFYDQLISFSVGFGANAEYGSLSGPQGLQVPPPWGWNSSSLGIGNAIPGGGGAVHDQWALYGSLAEPAGTPANVFYRFELWGTSTNPLWETMPSLDALPGTDLFGQMGLNIWATLYDDGGNWVGETRLHGLVRELDQVRSSVPEPGSLALMTVGLAGMALLRRRKALSAAVDRCR